MRFSHIDGCAFEFRKVLREAHNERNRCTDLVLHGNSKTEIEAAKFLKVEFDLTLEKLRADVLSIQVYRSKLACHESLVYHAKVDHTRKRRLQARTAIESLFSGPLPIFFFGSEVDGLLQHLLAVRQEHRLAETDQLLVAAFVNWTSPSAIREQHLALQLQVLHRMMSTANIDCVGVILCPCWERTRGQLFKTESMLLEKLADMDINTDEKATLSFED